MERVVAWRPPVPGVAEVLHARFVEHAYPPHTHDTWALLVVDTGAIRFDLDRREYGSIPSRVTLLPPHVAHTGRPGTRLGFVDPLLRRRIDDLHRALIRPGDEFEAESRLALIRDRIHTHLGVRQAPPPAHGLAHELRDLLDAHVREGITLRDAGAVLGAHPDSLVRAFTAAFGLPPHRYLTGRRLDAARARLLAGEPVAAVATEVGFHDQAHLTRQFKRLLATTPARYAAGDPQ
jgi:AraC-like DNA-binding protein